MGVAAVEAQTGCRRQLKKETEMSYEIKQTLRDVSLTVEKIRDCL
jgi:hypothetical protein